MKKVTAAEDDYGFMVASVLEMGVESSTDWKVGVELMYHTHKKENTVYKVTQGGKSCCIVFGHDVMETSEAIDALFDVMKTYRRRSSLVVEGKEMRKGDLLFRVGKVSIGSATNTNTILEVEYLPCSHSKQGKEILKEAAYTLVPTQHVHSWHNVSNDYNKYHLGTGMSNSHYAVNYVKLHRTLASMVPQ